MNDDLKNQLIQEFKSRFPLKKFVFDIDYPKICDYCNGRPFTAPEIEPAVQLSKPLDYEIKAEK